MKNNRIALAVVAVALTGLAIDGFGAPGFVHPQQAELETLTGGATSPRWQLVGFSTQATHGGVGVLGMTALCQADFTGSRMCSFGEVAETTVLPNLPPTGGAWVHQFPVEVLTNPGIEGNCLNWTDPTNNSWGLTVAVNGGGHYQRCNGGYYVACCAPV